MIHRALWLALTSGLLAACTSTSSLTDAKLAQAATQGDGRAQYELATRLAAKPDYPEAMRWMKRAADGGELGADKGTRAKASLQVGEWYQAGLGEPKDPAKAQLWWRKASRLGSGIADYRLGVACQASHGGKVVAACIDDFESAAERGNADAQLVLAAWYGSKPEQGEEAVEWFEKAAKQGNKDAQYELARRYETGNGILKSRAEAERWYVRAAAQKQPQALLWMGRESSGEESLHYYQQAAHEGVAEAQLWLAMAYLTGERLERDEEMGRYWLERAAQSGSHEAQYQLSLQQGDADERERYLILAAQGGLPKAQLALGKLYREQGKQTQARAWFARAADQGDERGRLAYAEMLRWGLGGEHDYPAAYREYRLAAMQGNRMAQYRMGAMREEGLGGPKNRLHAYAWFSLAATDGMEEAIKARDELESGMKPDEVKQAQRLAQHWFGKQQKG
ncbi:tetratricopeptide repeat protein [Aeromonas schubertii]